MVNNLVKLPEISAQMQEMSREMMKVWAWTWNQGFTCRDFGPAGVVNGICVQFCLLLRLA